MDISTFSTLSGKRVLVVAEKPSVAKKIFGVLSNALKVSTTKSTKGKSKYNRVYHIIINDNEILITSVLGFIHKLEYDAPFTKHHKWRLNGTHDGRDWTLDEMLDADAHWEVGGKGSYKRTNNQIISQIKQLALKSHIFVNACDNDFAGELIGWQALQVARSVNKDVQALRMVFPSVTYGDIINAWQDLQPIRIPHKDAEEARQRTDLMTGATFTRLLTLLVQEKVPGVLISWGGCQTLFLKHISDKWRAHEEFEPDQYWEVFAIVEHDGDEYVLRWNQGRQLDRKLAKMCIIQTRNEEEATVTEVKKSEWKKYPPVPLRTATLLHRLSKITGLSPARIMDVAENLYNNGLISYPRTENEVHPYTFNANNVLEQFADHPKYGEYTSNLLNDAGKRIYPRKGRNKTSEHDPIYPTKSATQQQVESAVKKNYKVHAWRVYDFIARHFIATCSQAALFHKTEIKMKIDGHGFDMDGKIKVKDGFMDIYPFYHPKINKVPNCKEGDELLVKKVDLIDGWTQPPALADEAEVIKWASDNSIGTDATFHSHIETVQKRNYVIKNDDKKLVPTDLGLSLVNILESTAPLSIDTDLRHDLQESMDKIAEGKVSMDDVIQEFRMFSKKIYNQLLENRDHIIDGLSDVLLQSSDAGQDVGICGKCGNSMHLELQHKYGGKVSRYTVCEGCDTKLVLPKQGDITPLPDKKCVKCGFSPVKIKSYLICPYCFTEEKDKGLFYCSRCTEKDCEFSGAGSLDQISDRDKVDVGPCPKCGSMVEAVLSRSKRFAKCSGEDCDFLVRLPRVTKGNVQLHGKKCPKCNMKLFKYNKKQAKDKYGKDTYFCIGCGKEGKYKWCFSCQEECKGGM